MTKNDAAEEKRVDLTDYPVNDSIIVVPWRGKTLHVRPLIEPEETMEIVNSVMSACYNDKDDTVVPEMRDFVFRSCVITKYTNAAIPDDMRERYKFVYLTDLFETVEKKANRGQIEMMKETIERMMFRGSR